MNHSSNGIHAPNTPPPNEETKSRDFRVSASCCMWGLKILPILFDDSVHVDGCYSELVDSFSPLMGRNSLISPEIGLPADDINAGGNGDLGFRSNYDRYLFKRRSKSADRHPSGGGGRHRARRKPFQFKGNSLIYSVILLAVFSFALASLVLQNSITSVFRHGGDRGRTSRHGFRFGSSLRFVPARRFREEGRLDRLRNQLKTSIRPPRLALF